MLLIGVQNTTAQDVLADGTISTGDVYRKYDKPNDCGVFAFSNTSTGITLHRKGIYHLTATFAADAAFTANITMLENGTPVAGAIATGDTPVIDRYIIVDPACGWTTNAKTISFTSDAAITLNNVVVNVTKEV
jgi:hypothetical protein